MATKYCKHLGNGAFDPRLFPAQGEDCYPYEPTVPAHTDSQIVFTTGFKWLVEGSTATGIYEVKDIEPDPTEAVKYSKLKLYAAITALPASNDTTAWEALKAWLEGKTIEGLNGWMAFTLAQEISNAHPLFEALYAEALTVLGLTREQGDALLAQCVLDGETTS